MIAKYRRLQWVGQGDKECIIFAGKPLSKQTLGRVRRWEDKIKTDFTDTGYKDDIK
jgi:hypothetical protein